MDRKTVSTSIGPNGVNRIIWSHTGKEIAKKPDPVITSVKDAPIVPEAPLQLRPVNDGTKTVSWQERKVRAARKAISGPATYQPSPTYQECKRWREDAGDSQRTLAEAIGWKRGALAAMEGGRGNPTDLKLAIAKQYNKTRGVDW